MSVPYVMVGFGNLVLELAKVLPPASMLVLEEPEIIEARGVARRVADCPLTTALVPAATHDEEHIEAVVAGIERPPGVAAVIPVNEYAVVAAAALAQSWGLPGAGLRAARTFRDKALLRAAAATAGLPQPDWRLVDGPAAVAAFRAEHGGRCVLKPAAGQASMGVSLLGPHDDVAPAWRRASTVDESSIRAAHPRTPRYLAEERLDGPEVSVEALVHAGEVVFENVTAKLVLPGPCPVELGQGVPAELPAVPRRALGLAVRDLVAATGFGYGVLHAEWILVDDHTPYLVECAARLPGDNIPHLIDLAYGPSIFVDYVTVLRGRAPATVREPVRGAAIRFLTAEPGVLTAIGGVEAATARPDVHEVAVHHDVGEHLGATTDSWTRPGYVMATGPTGPAAVATAAEVAAGITLRVAR